MPSKLKKAILAVKDQTSISLAKVGGSSASNLEVAILKATTHEEVAVDERYVTEVLQYVSSNRAYAASCARAIGRRIGRTRNWVVAIKSLMLVLRIFQDGDPHFPKEVLHAMKRGYKILNLSGFRDDSTSSCPWDFTAFVRTFALYLDERLDCFLTGKLQRRTSHLQLGKTRGPPRKNVPIVRDMKPSVLLDRISHWQRLLDRAIATRPTGAAKTNRLVQTCLHTIVQETFELYRDVSDGLALLLDSFFHLQYNNCVSAFQTCVKASKQFEELCSFYEVCKSIGVGRTSEYPSVQKISDELVETLKEFLKDQSSFPPATATPGTSASLPPLSPKHSESGSVRQSDRSLSEFGGSHCTSLEDLMGSVPGFSPDRYSDPGRENPPDQYDNVSVRSEPTADHRGLSSVLDLLSLDGPMPPPPEPQINGENPGTEPDNKVGWELVLFETSNQTSSDQPNTQVYNDDAMYKNISSEMNLSSNPTLTSSLQVENNYLNPFLADTIADLNGVSGAQSTSFVANFTQGDLAFNLEASTSTTTIPPTFQVDLCNSTLNGFDGFSDGFSTDLGFGRVSSLPNAFKDDFGDNLGVGTTSPTLQTELGKTRMNGLDHFSGGFPTNLSFGRVSSLPAAYKDDFEVDFGSEKRNFAADLGLPTGSGTSLATPPTFRADLGNTSTTALNSFPTNLGFSRVSSLPTVFNGDFGADFGSEKSAFVAEVGVGTGSGTNSLTTAPTFQAKHGNTNNMSGLDRDSGSFPATLGIGRVSSLPTTFKDEWLGAESSSTITLSTSPTFQAELVNTSVDGFDRSNLGFKADFGDSFGTEKSNFIAPKPTFQAEVMSNGIGTNKSLQVDFFGNFGDASAPKPDHFSLGSDSFSSALDGTANDMNAIVIFSQPRDEDDFFSSCPKLQAAPTFRANSADMDHQDKQFSFCFENDPFGSFAAVPALEQQQQLWLQNQNKIMARHMA